ncbi:MAG TPA: hypothetical protein VNJ28_04810, partial [Candidatus Limnocylindrales bacterium]|nr:hypothetical protein [Candidatus Limnocylindrales bacterium]
LDLGPLVGTGLGAPTGAEGRLQLAWSLTGEVLALGVDPAFVRAILDAPGTGTLAGTDRYRALVDRVGAENAGSVFVDLGTARELLEGRLPDDERADYEADVRPYLEPFDALVSTLVVGSDVDRARMILTVE